MQLDLYVLNLIRQYVGIYKSLDAVARWCAEGLGYLVLALAGIVALYTRHWQLFFMPLCAGIIARFAINEAVYTFYRRKRPSEVLAFVPLIKKPKHPAFPSGHASFFGAFAF